MTSCTPSEASWLMLRVTHIPYRDWMVQLAVFSIWSAVPRTDSLARSSRPTAKTPARRVLATRERITREESFRLNGGRKGCNYGGHVDRKSCDARRICVIFLTVRLSIPLRPVGYGFPLLGRPIVSRPHPFRVSIQSLTALYAAASPLPLPRTSPPPHNLPLRPRSHSPLHVAPSRLCILLRRPPPRSYSSPCPPHPLPICFLHRLLLMG